MNQCKHCSKDIPGTHYYCDWKCYVDAVPAAQGLVRFTQNNLPINTWRENAVLEHEHADHPTYMFPVEIQYVGPGNAGLEPTDENYNHPETHALIYTDGTVAVTIFEYCFAFWYVRSRKLAGGSLWKQGNWELSKSAQDKIFDRYPHKK